MAARIELLLVCQQTLGNHEFDYGPDVLANFTTNPNITFPILGANINATAHPVLGNVIKPFTLITLKDGVTKVWFLEPFRVLAYILMQYAMITIFEDSRDIPIAAVIRGRQYCSCALPCAAVDLQRI